MKTFIDIFYYFSAIIGAFTISDWIFTYIVKPFLLTFPHG